MAGLAATIIGCGIGQYKYGYQKDFFDYRFITHKDPDDLATFYGGEEFMELFCVVPFMGTLMMRGGYFDEEGTVHTTGFPGEMQVSMVFSDEQDDSDGRTKWFNKRERFRDVLFGFTCWDMVTNFGFERLDDGRIRVYHHGEYFSSSFPPFSLMARLVFGIHARWVSWATEHYLNHYAFSENDYDEELEEQARTDMPLFLLRNYAFSDLMAVLSGRQVERPSFLIRKQSKASVVDEDDDEDHELPVFSEKIKRRITLDIREDRINAAKSLTDPGDSHAAGDAVKVPLTIALRRTKTLTRRMTKKVIDDADDDNVDKIATELGGRRHTTSGSSLWEAAKSTNDPKAYQALTVSARERQIQRRETLAQHQNFKDKKN